MQQVSGRRPIYHQVKVAGQLSGHPDWFSATVTLSWAPDQLENSSQWVNTMTVVRSVLVILLGVFVATTAR